MAVDPNLLNNKDLEPEREPQIIDIRPEEERFADVNIRGLNPVGRDRANLRIAARERARVNSPEYAASLFPDLTSTDVAATTRASTTLSRARIEANKRFEEAKFRAASWSSRLSKDVTLYPSIAAAMAKDPTMTEADVKRLVNFTSAWAATDAYFAAPTQQSQWNILLSLPDNQRAVVSDIIQARVEMLTEKYNEKEAARIAEEESYGVPRKIGTAGLNLAGAGVGGVFKAWEAGVEFLQHTVRAGIAGGNDPFGVFKKWDETNIDRYNEEVLDEARKEYGDVIVDFMVEMRDLKISGDPSPLTTLQSKYVGDPERMPIINDLIHRAWNDPERIARQEETLKVAEIVNSASTGDLGQMLTTINPVTGKPIGVDIEGFRGSELQQFLAGTTNFAATFALDPLIVASPVRKAYLGARYGLEKLAVDAGVDVTTKALNSRAVYGYLDQMGSDIAKLNKAADEGKDITSLSKKVADDHAKYFPEDVIVEMRKAKVTNAEDIIKYVNESNDAIRISRGEAILAGDMDEAARLESSSVFGRMIGEQTGRRAKPLLPRQNVLTNGVPKKIVSAAVSKLTPKGVGKSEVQRFYKDVNDPNKTTGDILIEDAARIGEADRGRSIGYLWDKVGRLISTTPGKMIYTADARDTKVFYKYARMHVSSYQAKWLAEEWRNASQAERIKMWIGIVRTSASSRGFDDIAKIEVNYNGKKISVKDLADEIDVSRRSGVMYSPSSINIFDNGIQTSLDDIVSMPRLAAAQRKQAAVESEYGFIESVVKTSDNLERPSYSFGNDEIVFVGSDEAFGGTAGSASARQVQANPESILEEAIRLNPSDNNLKTILANIRNKNFGEQEVKFLDSIIASVAIDDAGKVAAVEQTSGFALVLSALSGNKNAQKLVDDKIVAFQKNVKKRQAEDSERFKELNKATDGSVAEPVEFDELVTVHSTQYDFTRNADGSISLNPSGYYIPGLARSSIHFTLNSEVKSHMGGQWADTNKLIVTNANDVVKANGKPASLSPIDSWWKVSPGQKLKLPNASVVNPFIDEAAYVKELKNRGLIKPGEKTPIIVEDPKTNDVFYFSKAPEKYTDDDRVQILEAIGQPAYGSNVTDLIGKESETLRRHALDLAMRQQKVTSGPEALGQWGYDYNAKLGSRISDLNAREGIGGGIHQGTPAQRLEEGSGNPKYSRFDGSEIETYRWIAAQGLIKPQNRKVPEALSRIEEDFDLISSGVVNENLINKAYRESPSSFNGKQHPLHLWQTSDYLAVPNMNESQRITKRNAILMATQGNSLLNDQATNLVSWWSLLNLAGPRYSMRNSIEDYVLYALTGGYFTDVLKGRAFSVGTREARGRNIGIVARNTTRKIGKPSRVLDDEGGLYSVRDSTSFWNRVILPNLDPNEVAAAREATKNGDMSMLRDLSVTAVLRTKLGKLYNKEDKEFLADFVSSSASFSSLDEVAETATFGNLGLFPTESLNKRLNGVSLGGEMIGYSKTPIKDQNFFTVYPKGAYGDVAMHGDNFGRWSFWQDSIAKTINSDGIIGKLAVMYLDDMEKAVAAVSKAIKNDTKYGYKEKLVSASGADVDEYARRYVQDVLNTFSDQNGNLNQQLWNKFIDVDKNGNRKVEYWVQGEQGVPRVSIQELIDYPEDMLPKNILGKSVEDAPIVIPVHVSDKIFQAMGEAVARISKEPIFFANYLSSRRQLTSYQSALAEQTTDAVAKDLAHRHALNRAMEVTLSYTDNPANRTVAAWRMRNWARYYRATEDFYRRVYRMAKYEPIGFYKGYLAVGALEDVGVINEDEFGNKYFVYPGDNVVNNFLGQLLAANGDRLYLGATPLMFTGNLTMLAPSFDPKAAVPQLQGPLSSFLVKSVISIVPQFAKTEKYLLGEYSVGTPLWQSMFPAPIAKLYNSLNQDERDSSYASAVMAATRILEGAGMLPNPGQVSDPANGIIGWDESQRAISDLAVTVLTTRLMLGFLYPASPQVEENDVTMLAREYGIPNMRSNYIQMANKYIEEGDPDPWGRALMEGVETFGLSYTPYKTSKTTTENILKSVPEISRAADTLDFVENNKPLVNKYGASAMFLAPISAGYSAETVDWLEKNDYLSSSSTKEFALSVAWSDADYEYSQAMKSYYAQMAEAKTDSHRTAIEAKKDEVIADIYADYGLAFKDWKTGYNPNGAQQIISPEKNVDSVRNMVDDFYAGTFGDEVPESVTYIAQALETYDYFMPSIKEIEGQTNAAKSKRSELKNDLLNNLKIVASKNVNAEMFIRKVLYRILDADSEGNVRP